MVDFTNQSPNRKNKGLLARIRGFRLLLDASAQQAFVVGLLASIAMVGTLGITIDGVVIFTRVSNLQNVADRAAIIASRHLGDQHPLIDTGQTVEEFIRLEGLSATRISVETCDTIPRETWNLARNGAMGCGAFGPARVRVTIDQTMPALFLRLVMPDTLTISVSSVAEIESSRFR